MTDEQLRAAYARAMASPRSAERTACPSPDALIALVQRQGSEAARLETLDHTMACAACQREFELLRAIDAAERNESGGSTRAFARWQRPLALALAASLVLAIGLGPGRTWLADRQPDTMRGDPAGIDVVRPEAAVTVPRDSLDFVWRPVSGASRYTVELLTLAGAVRLSATTTDTTLILRGARDVDPGEYRWWVRAALPGGERRSQPRPVTLRQE